MSENERETHVRSIRLLPPVEIDCSTWAPEVPAEEATYTLVSRTLPPVVVDCAGWEAEPALAVSVRFEDGAPADAFVLALCRTAHTRPDAATVVVALRDPGAVAALSDAFRGLQTAGCVIGPEADGFRVRRRAS